MLGQRFWLDSRTLVDPHSAPVSPMRPPLKLFVLPVLLLVAGYVQGAPCGAPVPNPDADPLTGRINVGSSGRNFTVFAKGNLTFDSAPAYYNNTFTGPSYVQGNLGFAGTGDFSWSDGTIDGDVYMSTGGTFKMSGPAHFTAGHMVRNNQDPILNAAFSDFNALSNAAASDPCTTNYSINGTPVTPTTVLTNVNITNASQSMTIMGAPGQKVVISLQNFIMSAGTFTLQGTATSTFIINVAKSFSLNNAKILLSGVPPANVLFNIRSSGQQISLNQGTEMSGVLLALGDKVSLSGGKVYGRVVGDQVNITSGGQVISR